MIQGGFRAGGIYKSSKVDEPLLSVITVVYNGALKIEKAINSVLSQDYSNVEYIIIDGSSNDGTINVIRGFDSKIDFWLSEPDNGIYDAMNKGIMVSNGDLIGILNSDDYYEPGALEEVVGAYLKSGCQGIFFGNSYVIQEDLGIRYLSFGRSSLRQGLGFRHQAMFVHREVHNRIGLYDTSYRIAADYDFVLRAVSREVRLIHIDKSLVNYSNTGVSGLHRFETMNEIRKISKHHMGVFSYDHICLLFAFARSAILQLAGKLVLTALGSSALLKMRIIYTKFIFARQKKHR